MVRNDSDQGDPRDALFAPLTFCKGVGPSRTALFNRLGLFRAVDLLFYFPRDYRDLTRFVRIADLIEDEIQTIRGEVVDFHRHWTRRGPFVSLTVEDESGDTLEAVWFNQTWQFEQFAHGRRVLVTGTPDWKKNRPQMSHPRLIWLGNADSDDSSVPKVIPAFDSPDVPTVQTAEIPQTAEVIPSGEISSPVSPPLTSDVETAGLKLDPFLPIYPLTEGLRQYHFHKVMKNLLTDLPDALEEVFPDDFRETHHLLPIADAVRKIHFPKTLDEAREARRRFIYQELLLLQLALSIRRQQHEESLKAPSLPWSVKIESRIRRLLPFDLTEAQKRVVHEIADDLARPIPMNRLLQGDVGSGKTIVAAIAMLQAAAGGHQAVLMAPTEVLARQHLRFLTRLLENTAVTVVPLLGGQRPKEREEILAKIQSGEARIVVGTQAIVCNDIEFHRLGLIVIDEQHKFGVRQRARLKTGTGADPHYLVMTATPIPRSVTMTVFGDLDVSILDTLPPGRQPVRTYVVGSDRRAAWWDFFRKKIAQGRQGYVVVPRVEETGEDLKSVEAARAELSGGELAGFRLGVLHGRMTSEEKEAVMLDFRSRAIEVLVSTSVIEVGVDIPNATLMTIENGNMFGLAQLHQLRGRIGRGKFPGFCAVFVNEKPEAEEDSAKSAGPVVGKTGKNASKTGLKAAGRKKKKGASTLTVAESAGKGTSASSVTLTGVIASETSATGTETTAGGNLLDSESEETRTRNDPSSRLEVFANSTDGFFLAEKDFEMRGPGDLFGTEQHGLCHFRIADLVRDKAIVEEARSDAAALVKADPGLADPIHHALRRQVLVRYGKVLDLGDVG